MGEVCTQRESASGVSRDTRLPGQATQVSSDRRRATSSSLCCHPQVRPPGEADRHGGHGARLLLPRGEGSRADVKHQLRVADRGRGHVRGRPRLPPSSPPSTRPCRPTARPREHSRPRHTLTAADCKFLCLLYLNNVIILASYPHHNTKNMNFHSFPVRR